MGYQVEVVDYNPAWSKRFLEEAAQIRQVLGRELVAIYHMGSTSVPGIKAKPIIDILVEVQDIEKLDGLNDHLVRLGYEAKGEFGIIGRRFFIKNDGAVRTHHLHVFQSGHSEISRVLTFRDYLCSHPEEAQAYGQLKEALAQQYPSDRESYTEGKTDFIRELDRKAMDCKLAHHPDGHPGSPPGSV
jgi:GrpB-like predicted nucleotidyltransferase (UPF0157 family)